jgi:circadian clock protein KaiB
MSAPDVFKFRLYVADEAINSTRASANLAAICSRYLAGRHEVETIDVLLDPMRALADHIYMTPTLLKLGPLPMRRIVGNLSQTDTVLMALGIDLAQVSVGP